MKLDPWRDAAEIARRLAQDGTELILLLGAEAWCRKCRALRPAFERLAEAAPEHQILLWLDLDEHAPFLGDYLPDDLPELLIYHAGHLTGRSLLPPGVDLAAMLDHSAPAEDDPGLWWAFVQEDWAA